MDQVNFPVVSSDARKHSNNLTTMFRPTTRPSISEGDVKVHSIGKKGVHAGPSRRYPYRLNL